MTYYGDELDKDLKEKLDLLQETPARDPVEASKRRDEYLRKVKYLHYGKPMFAIAGLLNSRPWNSLFGQRPSLVPFAAAILLIFGLVFGSVGTVYAAQDSLPNDPLYTIKLAGENLRLAFTPDSEDRITLLTSYADRRLQEATALDVQGQSIPVELVTLMDTYIQELTSLTDNLDGAQDNPVAVSRTLRPQDRENVRDLDQLRFMAEECHRIANPGDGNLELNKFTWQYQFKHAQAGSPDAPNMFQQSFQHQQGITSTLTSTITTTLTITPEITATLTITPGQWGPGGPGPCDLAEGLPPYVCAWGFGEDTDPFYGDRPIDDGYGPGDSGEQSPGPQQPSEPPKAGEPKQTSEPPNNDDNGKDNNQEGSSGQYNKP